jgi:hypothetical protein
MTDKELGVVASAVTVLAININALTTRTIIIANKYFRDMLFSLAERLKNGFHNY